MKYEVKPGARIGRLTVISPAAITPHHGMRWLCRCSCGTEKILMERKLRYGETLSCGCLCGRHSASEKQTVKSGCQKTDCRYHSAEIGGCLYFIAEGHTRTFLHLGENVDINNPCREYSPGPKVLAKTRPFTISPDQRE